MSRFSAVLAFLLTLASAALAQVATPPNNVPIVCGHNDLAQQLTSGQTGFVQCDGYGNLQITGNNTVPSYSSAIVNQAFTVAGDIYCIIGSATKTVKIKGIRVSATATAAIVGDVSIILRSTLDTGGGLASVPVVKMDQNNPAPSATVNSFTSAPTPGTSLGTVRARKLAGSTQGNSASMSEGLFQFSVYWDQPIVLRGTTQAACVNVSAFGGGAVFDIDHEHTEEPNQ